MKSKIILGTVQFGLDYGINNKVGKTNEAEVHQILDLCKASSISTLDTATSYGNSEERIGNYFKLIDKEKSFRIITKFSLNNGLSIANLLDRSLTRLNIDCVDTIMFHSIEDFKKVSVFELNSLLEKRGEKFLNLGISLYTNEQINEVCYLDLFNVMQLPFNALDNYHLRGEILAKLRSMGIEIHTRSVFLQGLFFMNLKNLPKKLKPLEKYLKKLDQITNDYKITKESLALKYSLSRDYIDAVLMGVDSLAQLESNLVAIEMDIPDVVFDEIDSIKVNEIELLNPTSWNK